MLLMKRWGVKPLFSLMAVGWGIAAVSTAFVTDWIGLWISRFFVGFFEGGFVPGAVFYLSQWHVFFRL